MAAQLAGTPERRQVIEDGVGSDSGLRPIKVYVGEVSTVAAEYDEHVMLILVEGC